MAGRWDPAPLDGGVPLEDQEAEARDRQQSALDEEERAELWAAFGKAAVSFAHVEGWSAVLNCIARAMRDHPEHD